MLAMGYVPRFSNGGDEMSAAVKLDDIHLIDAAATPALAKLFQRIGEMSTLPTAAQRIMQLASDESASTSDLLAAIEGDPVLAAKILRRVNSAFYGLRYKVSDLQSALSLLGFREIRNLALTVYLARNFTQGGTYRGFSREALWHHCVAVGQGARLIAKSTRRAVADEAYLAGLLHDLGLILLDRFLPQYLRQVVDRVEQGVPTCQAERELFPFDHTLLGAYVAVQWNFPSHIVAAIRYHHEPRWAPGAFREMAAVVSIANGLCARAGFHSLGPGAEPVIDDEALAVLKLSPAQLEALWKSLRDSLESSSLSDA
jgi:HD-like signal output (HDOD) protein